MTGNGPKGGRLALFGAVSVVLAFVVVLVLGEIALRTYHAIKDRRTIAALPPVAERCIVPSPDPELIWELNPGWSDDGFSVNGFGMADGEVTRDKPAGVTRIGFFGDSVTANFGLTARSEIYLNVIERDLAGVEALNFGVNGYGIRQTARALETKSGSFAVDLAIVQLCLNDPYPSRMEGLAYPPEPWSRLGAFVSRRMAADRFWGRLFVEGLYDEAGRAAIDEAMRRIGAYGEQEGTRVLAVLFPYLYAPAYTSWGYERFHAIYHDAATRHGVELLDLRQAFEAAGQIVGDWPIDPVHPDAAGHAVAAAAIEVELHRRNWIGGAPMR